MINHNISAPNSKFDLILLKIVDPEGRIKYDRSYLNPLFGAINIICSAASAGADSNLYPLLERIGWLPYRKQLRTSTFDTSTIDTLCNSRCLYFEGPHLTVKISSAGCPLVQ